MVEQKITIIIPARNEEANIGYVLREVKKYADEIIVVDGHSSDKTVQIAEQYEAKVVYDNGKGKGDAIRLSGRSASGDIMLFIDADCSHNPHDIPRLLQPILDGNADHVSGSRMLGGSDELFASVTEFIRLLGSHIITLAIGKRFNVRLTDSQNGFRCIRRKVFLELDLKENITTIEQEMVFETLRRGYRLLEVPTHEYRRKTGISCIKVWKVGFRYVWVLLRNLIKPTIAKLPAELPDIQEAYISNWVENRPSAPEEVEEQKVA